VEGRKRRIEPLALFDAEEGQFRSAGRDDIVEDLEWCCFLLMNAETAAINFVKKGSS